jgi:hypothetical protein
MEDDLGRPRCIFETKRVDRRPEKSAESSDFWAAQREEKLGFWGLAVVVVVARDFGALREVCEGKGRGKGKGKGRGFAMETLVEVVVAVLAQ